MLTINNERIKGYIVERRTNMEEVTIYSQEEEERLMKIVTENNTMILKLQKQLGELQVVIGEKKRQEIMRQREKEEAETDRWIEECRKRNKKEKEEKEEKKRIDKE